MNLFSCRTSACFLFFSSCTIFSLSSFGKPKAEECHPFFFSSVFFSFRWWWFCLEGIFSFFFLFLYYTRACQIPAGNRVVTIKCLTCKQFIKSIENYRFVFRISSFQRILFKSMWRTCASIKILWRGLLFSLV